MRVRVLLFAAMREAAGTSSLEIELEDGATVGDARRELGARHPALEPRLRHCRFALDREFSPPEAPLHEGCEIAVIPPVSGGSR